MPDHMRKPGDHSPGKRVVHIKVHKTKDQVDSYDIKMEALEPREAPKARH